MESVKFFNFSALRNVKYTRLSVAKTRITCVLARQRLEENIFVFCQSKRVLPPLQILDNFWCSPSLLFSEHAGYFTKGKAAGA